jgi:hypothetical protein
VSPARNLATGDRSSVIVETTKEAHATRIAAFLEGMRDLGYIEGQNVEIAYRFGNFDRARVPTLAEELARLSPHLIVAANPIAVLVVKSAAPATPVVCALIIDPIKGGLARSFDSEPLRPACAGGAMCAGELWRFWAMWAVPSPCWRWTRCGRRPAPSASRSLHRGAWA